MVTKLPQSRLPQLYKTHITTDFAPSERRPLRAILQLAKRGQYAAYVLEEGGEIQAYACFASAPGVRGVLLDYFAVLPALRGGGVGSQFLQQVRQLQQASGILIESEMPQKATTPEDTAIRRRRIAFYERAGAQLAPYGWRAFGVDYNLLWLPVNTTGPTPIPEKEIRLLYTRLMPRIFAHLFTRTYPL